MINVFSVVCSLSIYISSSFIIIITQHHYILQHGLRWVEPARRRQFPPPLVTTLQHRGRIVSTTANKRGMRLDFFRTACLLAAALACAPAIIEGAQENATVENGGWVFQGIGGCSVNGEQGKYGPNLVRPRLSFRDCARYANDAKVKVLTMYGDGFCMVQYLTRKDCLYSNLRIFGTGWVTACGTEPSPAANYTNDNMRGFQCFMKSV